MSVSLLSLEYRVRDDNLKKNDFSNKVPLDDKVMSIRRVQPKLKNINVH